MKVEVLAELLHVATSTIDRPDGSKVYSWGMIGEAQRQKAIAAVNRILDLDYNPTPEELHNLWMELNEGWTYGEVYDLGKRTHPCMVPFDELPLEEKAKDELWSHITRIARPMMER